MASCNPVSNYCGNAPNIANAPAPVLSGGVAGGSTRSLNAVAVYTCDPGYAKSGADPTCLASGAWSAAPTCTLQTMLCGAVPFVQNAPTPTASGGLGGGSNTSLNATITYSCNRGFVMAASASGSVTRTCQASGAWTGNSPSCVEHCFSGDFDRDTRRDDHACWNPTTGQWTARTSQNTTIFSNRSQMGAFAPGTPVLGDVPVVGDLDGDGSFDDMGVFRGSTGAWYAMRSNGTTIMDTSAATNPIWLGVPGDVPLIGDFDADGRFDDFGVWRPTTGNWYAVRRDFSAIFATPPNLGALGDVPMVGDFDTDNRVDDLVTYRPATFAWTSKRWADGATLMSTTYGMAGARPVLMSVDPDQRFNDIAYFYDNGSFGSGSWYATRVGGAPIVTGLVQGDAFDHGIIGDYDADGSFDDFGVWVPFSNIWYAIRINNTSIASMNGIQ